MAIKLELPAFAHSDPIIDLKACRVSPNRLSSTPLYIDSASRNNASDESSLLNIPPFHARPENAILVFEFGITSSGSFNHLRLITLRDSLLVYFEDMHGDAPRVYPWDAWGPSISRWFNATNNIRSAMVANGQRFAAIGSGQSKIVIIDFNPLTLKRLSLTGWGRRTKGPQSS